MLLYNKTFNHLFILLDIWDIRTYYFNPLYNMILQWRWSYVLHNYQLVKGNICYAAIIDKICCIFKYTQFTSLFSLFSPFYFDILLPAVVDRLVGFLMAFFTLLFVCFSVFALSQNICSACILVSLHSWMAVWLAAVPIGFVMLQQVESLMFMIRSWWKQARLWGWPNPKMVGIKWQLIR